MTSAVISGGLKLLGANRARKRAKSGIPERFTTGRSIFDTRSGRVRIDPSIGRSLRSSETSIRNLIPLAEEGFDEFDIGLSELRERSAGLRADLEGNQAAFREASLNPIRERISSEEQALNRRLQRQGVAGSFAAQQRASFGITAGRELSDATARIERERIETLSGLLGLDADLLNQGLASDTGRIQLLENLNQSLVGVSSERFRQELAALGLPLELVEAQVAAQAEKNRQTGIRDQAGLGFIGSILEAI